MQSRLLVDLINRGPWDRYAACSLADAARLDGVVGEPSAEELAVRRQAAQELCAHCLVRALCGAEADLNCEPGVWGGALRYQVRGRYVVKPLIPAAAPSVHDRTGIAARLARKRTLLESGMRKAMEEEEPCQP